MRIDEGRLVEQPCPDCGGIERRAFGEVETERGELASYALGWTAGHDAGRLTIGIGVGNPGGGSFHVAVEVDEDNQYAMGLVDEPFERVPEGGPDLTRDEALAHDTLPFIWAVADEVMAQDRRALWMLHYLHGTGALVTAPVRDGAAEVAYVVHDDDGDWQFLCATPGSEDEAHLLHLHHLLDLDPSLVDVLDLAPGERADREARGAPWTRSRG